MRLPVNHALSLALAATLLGGAGAQAKTREPAPPVTGPAADYPVVVGDPFQVGATTYTPEDRLNYDAVGYADVGQDAGSAISAAHKTLPLPCYVEVTALDSGKTILVRVERRGPMTNDRLIELSPAAAAQLGLAGAANPAVRVRRVNPPEQERAMLRSGGRAPERMATPKGLLDALNRKLAAGAAILSPKLVAPPVASAPSPRPAAGLAPAIKHASKPKLVAPSAPVSAPTPTPASTTAPAAAPTMAPATGPTPRPVAGGALVVQVAAFSTRDRAQGVAGKLGGAVIPAGRLFRVRLGPFATRAQAEAALAKAKGAGYSDARIQRAD